MKKLIKDLFLQIIPKLFSKIAAAKFEILQKQWWKEQINLTFGNVAAGNVWGGMCSLVVGFVITFFSFLIVNSCLPFDSYYKFAFPEDVNTSIGKITIKNEGNGLIVNNKNDNNSEKNILKITFDRENDALKAILHIYDSNNQPRTVEWWKTNNIAVTNEVFKIERRLFVLKEPSYPTSTSALVSWIREYGKKKIFYKDEHDEHKEWQEIIEPSIKNLNDDEFKVDLCGQLERIFERGCKFNDKGDLLLMFVRSMNGWIQFLCVVLFFAIGFMLFARHQVFRLPLGDLTKRIEKIKNKKTTVSKDLQSTNQINDSGTIPHLTCEQITPRDLQELSGNAKQREEEFNQKWGPYCHSPQWFVWRNGLAFFISTSGNKYSSLAEIANAGKDAFAVSRLYIHWMLDAIPALGFLGTVIGIGRTMMGTGSILTDELGKQQSRISSVALDLAFAFDTTLVALLLSLIIGAWLTHRIRQEEDSINKVQHMLIEKIQSQINEKN
jgi:hypothetical protein